MKNGFYKGFIDIPSKKYYKYHGLIMPCNIQPDPDPLLDYPLFPEIIGEWILFYDKYPTAKNLTVYVLPGGYPASSEINICIDIKAIPRYVYFYIDLQLYWTGLYNIRRVNLEDGTTCSWRAFNFTGGYSRLNMIQKRYKSTKSDMSMAYIKPPTHVRMWYSKLGNDPGYDPS